MGGQVMMSSCPSWGERQLRRELRASQSSFVFVRATEGELFAPSLFSLRLGGRRSPIAHCEGIIRCLGEDGLAYVLADRSVRGAAPHEWATAVAEARADFAADAVVAEDNQGGAMVEAVLLAVDAAMPLRRVRALRSKAARAEP